MSIAVESSEKEPSEVLAVDRRLIEYARHRAGLDAAEAFDLVRAQSLKTYLYLGFATMHEYVERRLGYGPHASRERLRVAHALATLPLTTASLAKGALNYSQVRELTRVATADTEQAWLEEAAGKTAHQVEELVAGHAPGDLPADPTHPDLRLRRLGLQLPPAVYALWRQVRVALATEHGGELSDADVFEAMCRGVLAPGDGSAGPQHQIAFKQCRDCGRATQNGGGREFDVEPEVFEQAACDARVIGSLDAQSPERATTTVTPRMREQVFARDQFCCRVPGCRSRRNLQIHHIIEQWAGGPHELWNLVLVCSGHHAALHTGLLTVRGRAPYEVQFRWLTPPIPIGLPEQERFAMIADRVDFIMGLARRNPRGGLRSFASDPLGTTDPDRIPPKEFVATATSHVGCRGPDAEEGTDHVPRGTSSSGDDET
jgi:hypothetical protein